jgi:hypothetical protein
LLALREYAARRGFSIYKEYVDHVSGDVQQRRAKRQNDHAYRELMDEASRRAFDRFRLTRILTDLRHWISWRPRSPL